MATASMRSSVPTTSGRPAVASRCRQLTVVAAQQPQRTPKHLSQLVSVPALLAGFAAAQIGFMHPGPAVAEVFGSSAAAPVPAAMQSIDYLADNAADIVAEVEDIEIPALEAKIGKAAQMESTEVAAAAERQLDSIEQEVAMIDEEELRNPPPAEIAEQTSGLLAQLSSLKSMLKGM